MVSGQSMKSSRNPRTPAVSLRRAISAGEKADWKGRSLGDTGAAETQKKESNRHVPGVT